MTPKLQARSLAALPGVKHAFFTREGGVSDGIYASLNGGIGSNDRPEHVTENRARMAAGVGVRPDRLLSAYQVHSPVAVVVDMPWTPDRRPRADALVTKEAAIAIAVTTADCGPILFADETAGVIAAAHAGWRGAAGGVIEATVAAMERCGAEREHVIAALGPMIRQQSYEVGPEFVAQFTREDPANARFFVTAARQGRALFDLPAYIAARLAAAGIRRIEDIGHCTYSDPTRFFSYRRSVHRKENDYGRHISVIALAR